MKETYYEEKFIFTKIEKEVFDKLKQIEPERNFVSAETVAKIKSILKMYEYTDEELQGLRNTIVRDFEGKKDNYDDWTRVSMITAVIDNEKFNRGMAI